MKKNCRIKAMSLLVTAALLAAGCTSAANTETTQQEEAAVAVEAVSPQIGTLSVSNEFIGTVSPQQQVSIMPLVSGEVDAVYFDVGDEVKAGDVLFHIDDEAAALQLKNAQLSKQSAEISAQTTLGSSQVLSNLSMQSNLKSIQYQIDMAKEQHNTAANGVADSEEAKEDLDEAIDKINDSVDSLEDSYEEMKKTAAQAKQCVEQDKTSGVWQFRKIYPSGYKAPWEYDWSGSGGSGISNTPSDTGADSALPPADGNKLPDAGSDAQPPVNDPGDGSDEKEADDSAADDGGTNKPSEEEEKKPDKEETSEPASEAGKSDADKDKDKETGVTAPESTKESESVTQEAAESSVSSGKEYAYFAAKQVLKAAPQYLAAAAPEKVPDALKNDFTGGLAEATEAYKEQLKVNAVEQAMTKMGYNAADIGEGRMDTALQQYASQIASMKSQAASLESNKSSLDSSIKSAETSRDTTKKTIDFYEDNLRDAQTQYGIQNGQGYEDKAAALATQLQTADLGIESARMQLEYYTVTAPISGKIISKSVDRYGMVQPGYAAYVISSQSAMNVTFYVSEAVKNTLHPGMLISLERNGVTYQATVTEIGEAVDAQTGLFSVKAVTDAGSDTLASGVTVKIKADTYRSDGAIQIPYDAVYFESEQAYVYVVENGKAVKTPITTGLYNDTMIEVTEGITPQSQIVKTWSSQLEDGAAVRIIGQKEPAQQSGTAASGAETGGVETEETAELVTETETGAEDSSMPPAAEESTEAGSVTDGEAAE